MWRYIRAFFKALRMTLRGETPLTPAQEQYPRLFPWLEAAQDRIQQVYQAADQAGYGVQHRQQAQVTIDGRQSSTETLLGAVKHHLLEEYPYMLRHLTDHTLTGIYASNLNDRYWLAQLLDQTEPPPAVQASIQALTQHLEAIPPSDRLGNDNS